MTTRLAPPEGDSNVAVSLQQKSGYPFSADCRFSGSRKCAISGGKSPGFDPRRILSMHGIESGNRCRSESLIFGIFGHWESRTYKGKMKGSAARPSRRTRFWRFCRIYGTPSGRRGRRDVILLIDRATGSGSWSGIKEILQAVGGGAFLR